MTAYTEQTHQDVSITQNMVLKDMIVGNVTVHPGARLELFGNVLGDLYVEANSEVVLYGILKGDAHNNGGRLRVEGVIKGNLHRNAGHTILSSQAVVGTTF